MEKQSEQQEIKDIITSREDGFGHRLKIARNERKLSTSDVARELRLDEKIILALENEDHSRLPVSAFVCGYIRNYAKLLNVQPEPLINCYKKEISEDSLDSELKITKGIKSGTRVDVPKVIAPIIMVLVIAALVLGGWKLWDYISGSYISSDNSTQLPQSSESLNGSNTASSTDPGSLLLPPLNESYYAPPEEEVSAQVLTTETPVTNHKSTETTAPTEVSVEAADSSSSEGTLPVEDSLMAESSVPDERSSATAEMAQRNDSEGALQTTETDNVLILEFSGNSWIVIKDADNNKLSSGLKKAGQTLRLEGKVPYNVFLGDGRVVKVSFHGKIYDHSRYINDKNIARFKVK